jgi:DNA-binding MarR family transcriptional regulator
MHASYHAAGRLVKRELSSAYVSMSEALVLRMLLQAPNVRLGELRAALGLAPSTLNSLINRLEDRGYVRREIDETDRRQTLVHPTVVGQTIGRMAVSAIRDLTARTFEHVDSIDPIDLDELATALDLLEHPEPMSRLN